VTLTIPTAFCSYHGQALDKKTPLLRSMDAVSRQALRVLRAIGNKTSSKVTSTVGPEQEYFLVDKELYAERLDLIACGRTLFGAPAPKGQEMEDHYFGAIKDRVSEFMRDLDFELWKMGISSKTKHNEVAPAQFEMAPIFTTTNIATDHNQLVMETMQKVALRHDLVCLLHEKPYAGINGSGKHNNWSLATDDGINLLEPGTTPSENMQFLLFLAALLKAVDTHADVLRATIASTGNDHRLGANEAPPAIVSVFMGDELTEILTKISKGEKVTSRAGTFVAVGVDTLPALPKDSTDRNRTSPFAFTGNKFEFRMVGSSASIAGPNVAINTIVAEALDEIAARLEKAKDVKKEAQAIVRDCVKKHQRVIFNGNNYAADWIVEAERRGLPNVKNTVDALKAYTTDRAKKLFAKYKVLSHEELHSRYDIYVETYAKQVNIEAMIAIQMVSRMYLPTAIAYAEHLAGAVAASKAVGASTKVQADLLKKVTGLFEATYGKLGKLEAAVAKAAAVEDVTRRGEAFRDQVFTMLSSIRTEVDALEAILPADLWPVPTYADLLYRI
jgi:glutamine synthetase